MLHLDSPTHRVMQLSVLTAASGPECAVRIAGFRGLDSVFRGLNAIVGVWRIVNCCISKHYFLFNSTARKPSQHNDISPAQPRGKSCIYPGG